MVDTINILVLWALLPEIVSALKQYGFYEFGGWYFQSVPQPDRRTGGTYHKLSGFHKDLRIVVRGNDYVIEWVQASLPRVLHGYNGRLIVNPVQLKQSQERLFGHLGEIAVAEIQLIEFIRVDLALNVPCDPRRMVLAHRGARHPWVRREDIQYGDSGIRFAGKERVLQMYWKQKERSDKAGFDLPPLSKSLRVELQIKGKDAVREAWGGKKRPGGTADKGKSQDEKDRDKEDWSLRAVTRLDFFQCYRVYRRALCLFDKHPVPIIPEEKCTLLALIGECEAQGFRTSSGISAWDWFKLGGQKQETVNRARAEVMARKQAVMEFRWADVLPAQRLPEPVIDIYPDGREVALNNLW
jgi:hypothetical protein